MFKRVLAYVPLPFRLPGGFFPFRDPIREALSLCEPLFSMSILGFGLWASSGPFPLSDHFDLYKRGRDPPTNPSRHLIKKRSLLHLECLLMEGRGRSPAAVAAAAAAPRLCAAAATTAATPCPGHECFTVVTATPPSPQDRRAAIPSTLISSSPSSPSCYPGHLPVLLRRISSSSPSIPVHPANLRVPATSHSA